MERNSLGNVADVGHRVQYEPVEHPAVDEPSLERCDVHGDVLDARYRRQPVAELGLHVHLRHERTDDDGRVPRDNEQERDYQRLNVDTFAVTFNEGINPTSVPATGTLTLSRGNGNTNWGISGLTDGTDTTGSTNYLSSSGGGTRTVTFSGTLTLSNNNQTITFTVTGACSGSCSSPTSTTNNGSYRYTPATTLRDLAGNAPSTNTITASSTVMF